MSLLAIVPDHLVLEAADRKDRPKVSCSPRGPKRNFWGFAVANAMSGSQILLCPVPGCHEGSRVLPNGMTTNEQMYVKIADPVSITNSSLPIKTINSSTKPEAICTVCGDKASGKHYGVLSCDGCRGFFKRSIRRNLAYVCKENGTCVVDVTRRNQCQACRFQKCLDVNMKKEAVQHERAPRISLQNRPSKCVHNARLREGINRPWMDSFYGPVPSFFPLRLPTTNSNPAATTTTTTAAYHLQVAREVGDNDDGGRNEKKNGVTIKENLMSNRLDMCEGSGRDEFLTSASQFRFHNPFIFPSFTDAFSTCSVFPITPTPESVHETAARLLFLAVKWARSIPAFLQLPFRDQAILLEEAWTELFILNAAQWSLSIDDEILVTDSQESLLEETRLFREIISRFAVLHVDHTEYACLKVLILFKPEARGLRDPLHVEVLQDQSHLMLQEYIQTKETSSKVRYGKLLLLLPAVRSVLATAIEEIFFRKTIGSVPIERLLCDMFKSS